jgi:hypothetical protein
MTEGKPIFESRRNCEGDILTAGRQIAMKGFVVGPVKLKISGK